jgi:hypothetical protein
MERRCFISFSLRLDASEPLSVVQTGVEKALGCTLRRGAYAGVSALVGELLGVDVSLALWRGIDGAHVYQLHGLPDRKVVREVAYAYDEIRIDDAIVDLLRSRNAGPWRKPLPGELIAESQYQPDDI